MASYTPLGPLLGSAIAALPQGASHGALRNLLRSLFHKRNVNRVLPVVRQQLQTCLVDRYCAALLIISGARNSRLGGGVPRATF